MQTKSERLCVVKPREYRDSADVTATLQQTAGIINQLKTDFSVLGRVQTNLAAFTLPTPAKPISIDRIRDLATWRRITADARRIQEGFASHLADFLEQIETIEQEIICEQGDMDGAILAGARLVDKD